MGYVALFGLRRYTLNHKDHQGDCTGIDRLPAIQAAALRFHYSVADRHGATSLPVTEDEG